MRYTVWVVPEGYIPAKTPTLPRCVRACLDSGSSLHLCPYTTVANGGDVVRVFGFDGSAQNTLGTGALSFGVASQDGDIVTTTLPSSNKHADSKTLISLGLLVKHGFRFLSPGGREAP